MSRRLGGALAWVCALAWACASALAATLPLTEVAPGDYVHLGRPLPLDAPGHDDIANLGFIIGTRCVAVIDTGGSVRMGQALRAAIATRTPRPICFVINTHGHVDHVLGNGAFVDTGATFVGHAALPGALTRSRSFFLENYHDDLATADGRAQLVLPTRTVSDALTLDLGGRRLTLRAWPPAHTDADLTVTDESTRVLYAGDLLFVGRAPALDGRLEGWLAAIDALAATAVARTVPGHGPLPAPGAPTARAWAAERAYLTALQAEVRGDLDGGLSLEDALRKAATEPHGPWLLWESVHPRNVARVYRDLEWR